jgi:hypothetical protein
MNNFTPFTITITQELDAFIFKALLGLIKTEQTADSIVQSAAVISYFNNARLEEQNKNKLPKEDKKEIKATKEKISKNINS